MIGCFLVVDLLAVRGWPFAASMEHQVSINDRNWALVLGSEDRGVSLDLQMSRFLTRPGKRLQFANLKMAIEIVSCPIKNDDLP